MSKRGSERRNEDAIDLAPRAIPKQRRAQQTRERILSTAATLLDEVGVDGFSTKLLAERARVLIRTVYRYFPNKQAIIVELARRMAEREAEHLGFFEAVADAGVAWRTALRETVDAFVAHALCEPGLLPVRRAMRTSPELRAVDDRSSQVAAVLLADALERRGVDLEKRTLTLVSRCVIDTATALLDRAGLDAGDEAIEYVEELKRILERYLAPYLEPAMEGRDQASCGRAEGPETEG
jgi:AcrR family transcriptional regulator